VIKILKKYFGSKVLPVLSVVLVLLISTDSFGQLNAREIRRKNKRIGQYRGTQSFSKHFQYQSIGFAINSLTYFGEIAPTSSFSSTDINFTRPGFTIFGTHRYGPRNTIEAAFSWGTVGGDDFSSADPSDDDAVYRYIRNLSFRNRISELSVVLLWDWLPNYQTYTSKVKFTPYGYAGLGLMYHNPKTKVNENSSLAEAGQWVKLRDLGTEGQNSDIYDKKKYSPIQITIPFGLGIRYGFNQLIDFSFQAGFRWLFTDYIDDVSGGYVDLGALDSDLARAMSDRSMELTSVTGEPRDFNRISEVTNLYTYTGVDGNQYTVFVGYGNDKGDNIRGQKNRNDIIFMAQIRITYILGGSIARAKYR